MKAYYKLIMCTLMVLISCYTIAKDNNYKVVGKITDAEKKPIEFAVVALLKKADSSIVKTAVSDADGNISIDNIAMGDYFLKVSNLGFETYNGQVFSLGNGNASLNIGNISLVSKSKNLKEVAIVASKPLIEAKADRIVMNVENSISSAGASVMEVLQKAPGVTVNQNDQISLRGRGNILITIDGKNMAVPQSELANVLKGMPAETVEKIELINSPGAKYDAAGASGMINIKTKKGKGLGTNGSLNLSAGHGRYEKATGGITLNHRNKKLNLFGNYNYAYRKQYNDLVLKRNFLNNNEINSTYEQVNYLIFPIKNHSAKLGMDYFAGKNTTLGFVANGFYNKFNPQGNNLSDILDGQHNKTGSFNTKSQNYNTQGNIALNLNAKHTFAGGKELSADADLAEYNGYAEQNYTTRYYDKSNVETQNPYLLYGDIAGKLSIKSFKADYAQPLNGSGKLEMGLKTSYVTADNDQQLYNRSNGGNSIDSTKTNHFLYQENINALYASYNFESDKYGYTFGIRTEQTVVNGLQYVTGERIYKNYVQFFPSASVHRLVTANYDLALSVNKGIERPTYEQLNPFKFILDPSTYKAGNPYLNPAISTTVELGNTLYQKYSISAFYSVTKNNITEVLAPSETEQKTTIQTQRNLANVVYTGLNIVLPFDVNKHWNSTIISSLYYGYYAGNVSGTALANGNYNAHINLNNTFTLGHGISAELTMYYNTPEVYGFLNLASQSMVSAGVKKSVFNDKGTLKLNFSDMFYTGRIKGSSAYNNYQESFTVNRETRVVTIAFTYRFGNKNVAPSRRRATGAEDEKKRANSSNG